VHLHTYLLVFAVYLLSYLLNDCIDKTDTLVSHSPSIAVCRWRALECVILIWIILTLLNCLCSKFFNINSGFSKFIFGYLKVLLVQQAVHSDS